MKKTILLFLISLGAWGQISLPAPSPFSVISQKVGLQTVTIEYSRPSLKGRKIFGNQVPYGKVWRTGANKITNIKFEDETLVNGQKVPAGVYGIFTIPSQGDWIVILNTDSQIWGSYDYNKDHDVLRFAVKQSKIAKKESLTFSFEDFSPTSAFVNMSWEDVSIRFQIEHKVDDRILKEIELKTSQVNPTMETLFDASDYYTEKGIYLDKALLWANKVVENSKEYWTYQLRARVTYKMGNCAAAVADANTSLILSKKAGDDAYIKKNEVIINGCKNK